MMESNYKQYIASIVQNYQFNKFLSVSAWSSLSTLIISVEIIA